MNIRRSLVEYMKWKHPPTIKTYEAIGAVADDRVEVSGNTAKVYSSTRNKFYDVIYDPEKREIMCNDNSSYWQGTLGYPAIAYLMSIKVLSYDQKIGNVLKGIAWKDINQKFKNNFDKTLGFILSSKSEKESNDLKRLVAIVDLEISELKLGLLGRKMIPPEGY